MCRFLVSETRNGDKTKLFGSKEYRIPWNLTIFCLVLHFTLSTTNGKNEMRSAAISLLLKTTLYPFLGFCVRMQSESYRPRNAIPHIPDESISRTYLCQRLCETPSICSRYGEKARHGVFNTDTISMIWHTFVCVCKACKVISCVIIIIVYDYMNSSPFSSANTNFRRLRPCVCGFWGRRGERIESLLVLSTATTTAATSATAFNRQ